MKLSTKNIQSLINPLKKKYSAITFEVNQSAKSSSVYVYMICENAISSLRIADHKNKTTYSDKEIIIQETTPTKFIRNILDQMAKNLYKKRVNYLFDKIKKEKLYDTKGISNQAKSTLRQD